MSFRTERCIIEAGLVLMFRAIAVVGRDALNSWSAHRLLLTALIFASANFEDDTIRIS